MGIRQFIKNPAIRFVLTFVILFIFFYGFNIAYEGITTPGNLYSPFLANHLNYIMGLRWLLLQTSAGIINLLGYSAITDQYFLLVAGHGQLKLVYSCLGLGLISFFAAFVIAYPRKWKPKFIFLVCGILGIELLNVVRFVVLELTWKHHSLAIVDHHTAFNIFIYIVIAVMLYFWVKSDKALTNYDAAN